MVLLYNVFHTAPAVRAFSGEELCIIAKQLAIRNSEFNVTGILHYSDREFFQILEGEKEAIDELLKLVDNDIRHENFHTVWYGKLTQRAYSNWGLSKTMALDIGPHCNFAKPTGVITTAQELFTELIPEAIAAYED